MTAVKAAGFDAVLRKPDPAVGVILIHGEDVEAVRALAARAVRKFAGSLDDPFAVVKLEDADLAGDPARLADEVQSISMFGGSKAIWVKDAGDAFYKAVAPILAGTVSGNMVVAEAGALAAKSALRAAAEKSVRAIIVPVYEAEAGDISLLIERHLKDHGLTIGNQARSRFMELAGTSRGVLNQELEKLSLYCWGETDVTLADVEASCGAGAAFDPDDLADAVFTGQLEDTDRMFHAMMSSGADAGRLLMTTHGHAVRLADFKIAMEKGMAADLVMSRAKPPVFFKRKSTIQAQLAAWPLADLCSAASTLGTAVLNARLGGDLAASIAGRALLSVARSGRSHVVNRM